MADKGAQKNTTRSQQKLDAETNYAFVKQDGTFVHVEPVRVMEGGSGVYRFTLPLPSSKKVADEDG